MLAVAVAVAVAVAAAATKAAAERAPGGAVYSPTVEFGALLPGVFGVGGYPLKQQIHFSISLTSK